MNAFQYHDIILEKLRGAAMALLDLGCLTFMQSIPGVSDLMHFLVELGTIKTQPREKLME
jgi:hypothetical protein